MGKTVLVIGAGSALGRQIAENLASSGHRVFASMRDPYGRNHEAANSLWARGIDVIAIDVADDSSVAAGVAIVLRKAGRIDVLVNNARIAMIGAIEAFTPMQVQDVLNTNVVGVVRTVQAVLPDMRRSGGGLIVNIGSVLGRVALPFFGILSTGKFALEALTDSLRYELSPCGVDVVLVQQSVFPSSAHVMVIEGADADASSHSAALGHISTRLEMAAAPDAGDVCGAICALIDRPPGHRPYRLVIGETLGADLLNRLAERLQRAALEAAGDDALAQAPDHEE